MDEIWLSLEEASRRSGRPAEEIEAAAVLGQLQATRSDDRRAWLIAAASLDTRYGLTRPAAAPKRCRPCGRKRIALALILLSIAIVAPLGPYKTAHQYCARCGHERYSDELTRWGPSIHHDVVLKGRLARWIQQIDASACAEHDWHDQDEMVVSWGCSQGGYWTRWSYWQRMEMDGWLNEMKRHDPELALLFLRKWLSDARLDDDAITTDLYGRWEDDGILFESRVEFLIWTLGRVLRLGCGAGKRM